MRNTSTVTHVLSSKKTYQRASKVLLPLVMRQWVKFDSVNLRELNFSPYGKDLQGQAQLKKWPTPYQDTRLSSEPCVQCRSSSTAWREWRSPQSMRISWPLLSLQVKSDKQEGCGHLHRSPRTERRGKKTKFSHQKEWFCGGRKPSRNELRRHGSAAASRRAELKHTKGCCFIAFSSGGSKVLCGRVMLRSQHLVVLLCCLPLAGMLDNTHMQWWIGAEASARPTQHLKCFLLCALVKKLILSWRTSTV